MAARITTTRISRGALEDFLLRLFTFADEGTREERILLVDAPAALLVLGPGFFFFF